MNRTQIYITKKEQDSLTTLSKLTGKSKSELIREAIDCFIQENSENNWKERIKSAEGIWKDRKDLPDFDEIRKSMDRF